MMQLHSNVSLEEGHRNLAKIIKEIGDQHVDWNEAKTRFHIIDRLLIECLGWPKEPEIFKVEVRTDGEFRDYVLGSPEFIVWEAKRSGAYFDFPVDVYKKIDQSIEGIFAVSKTAEARCDKYRVTATAPVSNLQSSATGINSSLFRLCV